MTIGPLNPYMQGKFRRVSLHLPRLGGGSAEATATSPRLLVAGGEGAQAMMVLCLFSRSFLTHSSAGNLSRKAESEGGVQDAQLWALAP